MDIKTSKIKRINFLKIPIDSVDEDSCFSHCAKLLDKGDQNYQITFLTMKGLFRARRNMMYYKTLYESSLVLPTARGIIRGAHFLKKDTLTRYNTFDFVINLLSFAEKNNFSVYLLGGKKMDLEKAELNVRTSFPGLKIIGRYSGFFDERMEKDILLAIKKSAPALLLVGKGMKGKEYWLFRNRSNLAPGISLWVDNCFEIFSGSEKYVPENIFKAGMESLSGASKKPWRFFTIFRYLYFNFLLLIYKIFKL
ncbi:MAG: WecB/TagA/CpsF family glycosyltransferase [Spirochaetales bacterium]|nr:WecB/TagA/CpsF family glycosyltransferase [Spirochaetales bacterium]